jgi:aminomethyltransferase
MGSDITRQTVLHATHVALGARMAPFGGWDMPIQYPSGILLEHRAVRSAAGLFDVSHMGRLEIRGDAAQPFLQRMLTNNVAELAENQAHYSLLLDKKGGTQDDLLVYRLPGLFFLIVNAGNADADESWLRDLAPSGVQVNRTTESTGMLAVQGPQARAIVQGIADSPLPRIRYYHAASGVLAGVACLVSRTGYTGEDGYELICPADKTLKLWESLLTAGQGAGLMPAGLGARDTLRTEAGMALHGHELSTARTPFEANLHHFVAMTKGDFVGKDSLLRQGLEPPETLAGVMLESRAPARAGTELFRGESRVGGVTSGTISPTLGRSIAMAYVQRAYAAVGTELEADIRGQRHRASVVNLPFYTRRRKPE